MDTLFLKVERLRRLYKGRLMNVQVRRGEDGTFGLGLTDDNEVSKFHHNANTGVLRVGDQVRQVGEAPVAPTFEAAVASLGASSSGSGREAYMAGEGGGKAMHAG